MSIIYLPGVTHFENIFRNCEPKLIFDERLQIVSDPRVQHKNFVMC